METAKRSFKNWCSDKFAEAREFFHSAKNICYLAVLLALTVVLQTLGGQFAIGGVSFNFTLIPIVLGAMLFGVFGGAFLGLASGIVVLIQVISGVLPLYVIMWTNSPVITTFTCLLKTTVAGGAAGLAYRLIAKKQKLVATFVAAGLVPVINTALFILGCLCMSDTILIFRDMLAGDYEMVEYSGMNIFIFIIIALVSFNFFVEFAINLLLAPAVHRVVEVTEKYIMKQHKKRKAKSVENAEIASNEPADENNADSNTNIE